MISRASVDMSRNDAQLVEEYLAGRVQSFDILVARYRLRLLRFIFGFVQDRGRAEDLVQEALIKINSHLHLFDRKRSFSTWVHVIAKNLALNEIRDREKVPIPFSSLLEKPDLTDRPLEFADRRQCPDKLFEARYLQKLVEHATSNIPDRYRETFILREFEGKSYSEIAAITKTPIGTVRSRLNRARVVFASLINQMQEHGGPVERRIRSTRRGRGLSHRRAGILLRPIDLSRARMRSQ